MKYARSQRNKRKHPLMPARAVAQVYLTIVTVVILMSLYQKTTRIQEAQAEHFVSPVPTKAAKVTNHIGSSTPAVTKAALPTPTPTVQVYTPTQEKIISLIRKVWKDSYSTGVAIASCESGINPDKVNYNTDGSVDYSVFQVNTVHGVVLDTEENISYAYKLFKEQGTTPWNSSRSCWEEKL